MKANNGKGNNESRDMWETPKWLFYKLNSQYDFNFDCCASDKNNKCIYYASGFQIVKSCHIINNICWMNPPFSKALDMFNLIDQAFPDIKEKE